MNPVLNVIEGSVIGFVEIYCILSITDKKRFKDWVSYLVGVTLSFLCGFNNTVYCFMDTNILFFSSFLFIFLILSKDSIVKRIATFLFYIGTFIVLEFILESIAVRIGAVVEEYSIQTEILRTYATVFLNSLYLSAVLVYRRNKIKNTSLLISILTLIAMLILGYDVMILMEQKSFVHITIAVSAVVLINLVFAYLFLRYISVRAKVQQLAKETELLAQIEEYDKEYFDLVQNEIDKARYIRHDVVNYIEQIEALTAMEDQESLELADRLSSELEERIRNQ